MSKRIVLADDHALVREGVKNVLSSRPGFEVVGEAGDGIALLNLLKHCASPDLIILDIAMPRLGGIEAISEIKAGHADVRFLVLTMHKDADQMRASFVAGANGFLLKEDLAQELFVAIDDIFAGKVYVSSLLEQEMKMDWVRIFKDHKGQPVADPLTAREREILKLVAEGKMNKEIADLLNISARTVEHHRASILEKLNIRSTIDLLRYAIKKHFI